MIGNVFAQTGAEGAPIVIEAIGNPTVMQSTIDLVAAGDRIVIVGLVTKGLHASLPGLEFTRKEVSIFGSRTEVGCFPEALVFLASDKIKYPEHASDFDLWSALQCSLRSRATRRWYTREFLLSTRFR